MALYDTRYQYKDSLEVWAAKALDVAGYAVVKVHRVYPPLDVKDGEVEVLYINGEYEPKTAILTPSGDVLRVHRDW